MKRWFDLKIVVLAMIVSLFMVAMFIPAPSAQAQGTPKPTPTNVPTGGGGKGDKDDDEDGNHSRHRNNDAVVNPSADSSSQSNSPAKLSGIVFNYSAKVGQGGVVVRLQGEGWQAETTTDGNGFYQFSGLGYGQATLKAQLPPGAFAVTPDWVVNLMANESQIVNLGYYLGSNSPLAVRLSSQLKGQTLFIEVVNSLSEPLTNGRLEIRLPSGYEALPTMKVTQGSVMYGVTTQRVQFDTLAAGAKVQIEVPFQESSQTQGAAIAPASYQAVPPPVFRVSFIYDQQQTPQLLIFAGDGTFFNRVNGPIVEPATNTTVAAITATTTAVATTTTAMTMATTLTPTTITNTTSQPPMLIPTTGFQAGDVTSPLWLVGLVLGIGLVASGWWAVRKKR